MEIWTHKYTHTKNTCIYFEWKRRNNIDATEIKLELQYDNCHANTLIKEK